MAISDVRSDMALGAFGEQVYRLLIADRISDVQHPKNGTEVDTTRLVTYP